MLFDIVTCLGPNDVDKIELMINHTKKNIMGYRNIYIISYDNTIEIPGCITIDENIFPFTKTQIEPHLHINCKDRAGWYFQQLLKLYAVFVIDGILDNILIIDFDTFFYKPTTFFEGNVPLFSYGNEYNEKYFLHMNKLHPSLKKQDMQKSGICHHMIMQKCVLTNLFSMVETYHDKLFYEVFIEYIDGDHGSNASEYEIYFNFMLMNANQISFKLRKLNFINDSMKNYLEEIHPFLDYVSYHHYL
jgi:hypothetical protein